MTVQPACAAPRPSSIACWVAAARPRTLPAAVAPVLVGSACAAHAGGFDAIAATLALAVALLLQIGTNFVNDWGDHRRGADGPERLGPTRAVAAGWITPRAMACGGAIAFALAAALGFVLVLRAGPAALLLGALSIAAGVAYTAGPFPLAYRGLGEPFVLAFFGPVAVCGTELVQRGSVSALALAASLPVGMLASAILVVNNVRDVATDARAGKRTLAVRIGAGAARRLYAALVVAALASPFVLWASGLAPASALLALGAAFAARAPLRAVARQTDGPALNGALAATARLHLVFGALLAAGIALAPSVAAGAAVGAP
ncbi:MAG TPA: 1,4-dihydroxy-2-naphthoate polyprenyltransferase [Candidatus Binatia bacterium]